MEAEPAEWRESGGLHDSEISSEKGGEEIKSGLGIQRGQARRSSEKQDPCLMRGWFYPAPPPPRTFSTRLWALDCDRSPGAPCPPQYKQIQPMGCQERWGGQGWGILTPRQGCSSHWGGTPSALLLSPGWMTSFLATPPPPISGPGSNLWGLCPCCSPLPGLHCSR